MGSPLEGYGALGITAEGKSGKKRLQDKSGGACGADVIKNIPSPQAVGCKG